MNTASRPFVVFATQRTGSSWLMDLLNDVEGVEGHQELFLARRRSSRGIAGRNDYPRFIESDARQHRWRPRSVFSYLNTLYERHGSVGFKLMYSDVRKFPEVLPYLAWRRVRILHLVRRNHLDVILSSALSRSSGRAHTVSLDEDVSPVHLDAGDLLSRIERLESNVQRARWLLRLLPCESLEVSYEELLNDGLALKAVVDFVAPEAPPRPPRSRLVKRQRHPRKVAIANYAEVQEHLSGSRWSWLLDGDSGGDATIQG